MRVFLALILIAAKTSADFSEDGYPVASDILTTLTAATLKSGDPRLTPVVATSEEKPSAYFLRRASYIGESKAPFGPVHVLALSFTRSAPRGSKLPSRGHSFVAFFDAELRYRAAWTVDFDPHTLSLRDGGKFFLGETLAFDYAKLSEGTSAPDAASTGAHVLVEGQLFVLPVW